MKRRENDQKIVALYVEMRDMMAVLVQCVDLDDQCYNDSAGVIGLVTWGTRSVVALIRNV
jgi:hypothetical protein